VKLFHVLPFASGPAEFSAIHAARGKMGRLIQPAGERGIRSKFSTQVTGLASQVSEDALGNVSRQIGRVDLSPRGGINEVRVTADNFGKGDFRAAFGSGAEQLGIGLVVHLTH